MQRAGQRLAGGDEQWYLEVRQNSIHSHIDAGLEFLVGQYNAHNEPGDVATFLPTDYREKSRIDSAWGLDRQEWQESV